MSERVVYADASALLKLFLDEAESDALAREVEPVEVVASLALVRVEILRALRRAGADEPALAAARNSLRAFDLVVVTDDLLERAERLEPFALRTLDALHLACALELGADLEAFLCYDRRLAEAARAHGLPVLSPGLDEVHEP